MTIAQLRCFVEVAKHLNFARAGEALYISQPAVSNQIRTLESELGIKLFDRTRHTVSLTAAGSALYADTANLLDRFSLAVQSAQGIHSHFSEELRIGYLGSLHISKLPQIYQKYQKLCPQVHILNEAMHTPIWNPTSEQESLDVVFANREGISKNGSIQYRTLYRGQMVCVLHKKHPLANRKSISFSDLQTEVLILLDSVHSPALMTQTQDKIQKACPNATFYFSSSAEHTLPMIQGQIGIAIMPDSVYQQLPDLVAIPIKPLMPAEYGVAWRTDNNDRKVKEFIRATCEQYDTKLE